MLLLHQIRQHKIQKEIGDNPQLLLTNKRGGFFYWQDDPTSRYQGFYFKSGDKMNKTVAQIRLGVSLAPKRIKNNFWNFEVERAGGLTERFFMDPASDSLIYELNNPMSFSLELDCKEIFDNDADGRLYDISEENGCVIVSYVKTKENSTQYGYFLAIAGNDYTWEKKGDWLGKKYGYDAQRRDPPYERYVFSVLTLKGKEFVFSAGMDKEVAKKTAKTTLKNKERIKKLLEEKTKDFVYANHSSADDEEIKTARIAAHFFLQNLVVFNEANTPAGLYAGIPWFTQFWFRDFAISAPQLDSEFEYPIFLNYLNLYEKNGAAALSLAADTEGLFFKVAEDLINKNSLNPEEKERIKILLLEYLNESLPEKVKDGLVMNNPKETWMDTAFKGCGRCGASIEIQALALGAFRLAYALTKDKKYAQNGYDLLRSVRANFWNGSVLRDNLSDEAIRPNVFLAYYFYSDLLLEHEWKKCFENVLAALWLPWGGLASLAKDHPNFCGAYRGCEEPDQSYHNGDSWFFVNNIAVLALSAVDAKRFDKEIKAIIAASTRDILWNGIAGYHSELSSADNFSPAGCLAQSWSAATYIEMIKRVSNPFLSE